MTSPHVFLHQKAALEEIASLPLPDLPTTEYDLAGTDINGDLYLTFQNGYSDSDMVDYRAALATRVRALADLYFLHQGDVTAQAAYVRRIQDLCQP